MTTLRSNVTPIGIKASGGSTGDGSQLAIKAGSMTVGQWAELTTNGINNAMLSANTGGGGVGGSNMGYANSMAWNPRNKKICVVGRDHGSPPYTPVITYDVASNTWSAVDQGLGSVPYTHAHDGNTIRPDTGDWYMRGNGGGTASETLTRQIFGQTTWGSPPTSPASYTQIFVGNEWWPGSNSGVTALSGKGAGGCLCICEVALGSMLFYDPIANTWELMAIPQTAPTTDPYHTLMAWSKTYNCCVYGGGNNGANVGTGTWIWRLDQNKTVTRLTDAPQRFGIQAMNLVCDPVTGKFLFWGMGRNFYELTPTGSGTWVSLSSRLPPVAGLHGVSDPSSGAGGPDSLVSVAIPGPDIGLGAGTGVIAYVSVSGASYSNMFLYRHA